MVVTREAETLSDEARAIHTIRSVPHILDITCRTTGMSFAAVVQLSGNRWLTCMARGRPGRGPGEEALAALCGEFGASRQLLAIDDLEAEEGLRAHPGRRSHGFRSCVLVPITRRDGTFFGMLSAIGAAPARVNEPATLALLRGFAELIARQLDDREALARTRRELRAERAGVRLRDEFVAVLGHDLRSPLASIISGLRVLEREGLSERAARTVQLMQATTGRMNALIENLLDLARGRLGQAVAFDIAPCDELRGDIEQVIGEIRAATGHEVEFDWQVDGTVRCDRRRMGQLASNLVSNAVKHGDARAPVRVDCRLEAGRFRLTVENRGEPIPPEIVGSLFRPFFRGGEARQGLGLGLYIAREIAKAHGGTLICDSTAERTRFTLVMPA